LNLRPLSRKDHDQVEHALRTAVSSAGTSKQWFASIDLTKALQEIFSGKYLVYIVEETYLVMADLGTAWFAAEDHKVLAEMLVLRVYPHGPGKFHDIPRALAALGRAVGARAIVVGTALAVNNRALARMYTREGFEPSATELYKTL